MSVEMMDAMVVAAVERCATRCAAVTRQELGRGLTGLATIVSVAPLLGLLATVRTMTSFPGCGADKATCMAGITGAIANGIAPTALGLLVALPTLWGYRHLTGELESFEVEMANATLDLVNRLSSGSR